MDSILEFIYKHDGSLIDLSKPDNWKSLNEDLGLNEMEDNFMKGLSKEQKREFEDILSLHYSINDEYMTAAFRDGFKLGSKIIMEIFQE